MAGVAHVGERQLSRIFREHAQISPLDYLHRIRLAAADLLLSEGHPSVESTALTVGYSSARQMRRVWRRQRGGSPRNRDA
jgi:transcriptional regulator GlxA family with amidase domain